MHVSIHAFHDGARNRAAAGICHSATRRPQPRLTRAAAARGATCGDGARSVRGRREAGLRSSRGDGRHAGLRTGEGTSKRALRQPRSLTRGAAADLWCRNKRHNQIEQLGVRCPTVGQVAQWLNCCVPLATARCSKSQTEQPSKLGRVDGNNAAQLCTLRLLRLPTRQPADPQAHLMATAILCSGVSVPLTCAGVASRATGWGPHNCFGELVLSPTRRGWQAHPGPATKSRFSVGPASASASKTRCPNNKLVCTPTTELAAAEAAALEGGGRTGARAAAKRTRRRAARHARNARALRCAHQAPAGRSQFG